MVNRGHVAIVEEIDSQGNITCSNSAYQSTYFFLTNLSASNNYNYTNHVFQGFIYNPFSDQPIPPIPPTPSTFIKTKFPWVLYARKLRNRRRK